MTEIKTLILHPTPGPGEAFSSGPIKVIPAGWQDLFYKIFAHLLADDPRDSKTRIRDFNDSLDQMEQGIVNPIFWTKIIQLMVKTNAEVFEQEKWEIVYILKEFSPMQFELIVNKNIDDSGSLFLDVYFNPEEVKTNPALENLPPRLINRLVGYDYNLDPASYAITIEILSDVPFSTLEAHLNTIDVEMEEKC